MNGESKFRIRKEIIFYNREDNTWYPPAIIADKIDSEAEHVLSIWKTMLEKSSGAEIEMIIRDFEI